jgi:hypothetical protein
MTLIIFGVMLTGALRALVKELKEKIFALKKILYSLLGKKLTAQVSIHFYFI